MHGTILLLTKNYNIFCIGNHYSFTVHYMFNNTIIGANRQLIDFAWRN